MIPVPVACTDKRDCDEGKLVTMVEVSIIVNLFVITCSHSYIGLRLILPTVATNLCCLLGM